MRIFRRWTYSGAARAGQIKGLVPGTYRLPEPGADGRRHYPGPGHISGHEPDGAWLVYTPCACGRSWPCRFAKPPTEKP